MKHILIALAFTLNSMNLQAKVVSCVFDGGGTVQDRACGSERAVEIIQSKYKGVSSDVQILSGSGKNGETGCMSPGRSCVDAGTKCETPYTLDSWDAETKSMVKVPVKVPKVTSIKGNLNAGTKDSFQNTCMSSATKQDVCHMWSINHGSPQGVVAYNPGSGKDEYVTPEDVRAKADQCGTFRYFTQSCYGAQMGAVIMDDKGKLIPGRCGISAAPAGVVAPGVMVEDSSKPQDIKIEGGNHAVLSKIKTPSLKYPMLEMMALDKGKSIAGFYDSYREINELDHKYTDGKGKKQETDVSVNTDYYMSSDYYLDEKFGKKMASAGDTSSINYLLEREKNLDEAAASDPEAFSIFNACSVPGNHLESTEEIQAEVEKIMGVLAPGQVLSEQEKKAVGDDLQQEYQSLLGFQLNTCSMQQAAWAVYMDGLTKKLAAAKSEEEKVGIRAELAQVQAKQQEKCDFNKIRAGYLKDRKKIAADYKAQQLKEEAAVKAQLQTCVANNLVDTDPVDGKRKCRDLDVYEKNLRVFLKTHCIAPGSQKVLKYDAEAWNPEMCDLPEGRDKIKLRNRLRDERIAVAKARADSIKMDASVEAFLTQPDSLEMRSYESKVMRFNRILNLYRKGTPENVKDYLMLRDCEKGDINTPAITQ